MRTHTHASDGGQPNRKEPAVDIVEVVADANDVEPFALGPLTEAVDPDALNTLLTHAPGGVRIEFEYEGRTVTAHGDGRVRVE